MSGPPFSICLKKGEGVFAVSPPILLHLDKESVSPREILEQGFSQEAVALETREAVGRARAGQRILPIIQSEDDYLEETAGKTLAAGAAGVGYYAYGMGKLPPDFKK